METGPQENIPVEPRTTEPPATITFASSPSKELQDESGRTRSNSKLRRMNSAPSLLKSSELKQEAPNTEPLHNLSENSEDESKEVS